jgi:hypothetical protein
LAAEIAMPLDVATWASVASLFVSVIALFPRDKRQRTQEQENALLAVSEAYHQTAAYLRVREASGRSEEQEWTIAEKWARAATLLRRYDQRLAQRLGVKSRFWREGGAWSDEAIKEADIGLSEIWQEVNLRLEGQA